MVEPQKIGAIVDKVMGKLTDGNIVSIRDRWRSVLGEDMAKHTVPVSVKKGKLLVQVDSSTWLQHLTMRKREILRKLRDEGLGEGVTEIRFRHGTLPAGRRVRGQRTGI